MSNNGYFVVSDPTVKNVGKMDLLPSWWSRPYEYAWAAQFTDPSFVVADMGAGWSGRPFKEHLASTCKEVYAVDLDPRLTELPNEYDNMRFVIGDFTKNIPGLPTFDRIFCISVLEDLIDYKDALSQFKSWLKPDGRIVITCDTQYDHDKPLPKYPGVNIPNLFMAMGQVGLVLDDPEFHFPENKEARVSHEEWNLCCIHLVLKHENS